MLEPCCNGDLTYLVVQINLICLLLFLIGTTALVKYPDWFGGLPPMSQSVAGG